MPVYRVDELMAQARQLAADYRRATGKTLAVSGEIAVSDAINLLGLEPAPEDADGYDALRVRDGTSLKVQVKARAIFGDKQRPNRVGQLKIDKNWDLTVLVLMDDDYQPIEMIEATRDAIGDALADTKTNKRGSLSVARFRNIGRCIWSSENPSAS